VQLSVKKMQILALTQLSEPTPTPLSTRPLGTVKVCPLIM